MTIYVERYRVCKRCDERSPVKYSIENRLSMSYHGMVGVDGGGGCKSAPIYHRACDVHLCKTCSEEFIQWMKGGSV